MAQGKPGSRTSRRRAQRSHGTRTFCLWLAGLALVVSAGWFGWLYLQMRAVGDHDDAHPSPVYHARLDHAVSLYQKRIAPVVVTLGGSADERYGETEGSVGRDYLLAQGVPYDHIIAETESVDTEQQAERLAEIARERGFRRVVVVSDPTHLFRIAELCRGQGLAVYTSPRSSFGNISRGAQAERVWHEMLSYTAMRLHLEASFAHRWVEGKEDL